MLENENWTTICSVDNGEHPSISEDVLYKVKYPAYASSMRSLQRPLRFNAIFSLASGILLTAAPSQVNDWLGVDAVAITRLFGVALLGHAVLLLWGAAQPNPQPFVFINLIAIAPYPLAMIALVTSGMVEGTLGQTLVLADGAIIAAISLWHWRAHSTHRLAASPAAA